MSDVRARMMFLTSECDRHNRLYHDLNTPEVPDSTFDAMLSELVALEYDHPEWESPDTPTKRVGGKPMSSLIEVTHDSQMLSLDKVHTIADLQEFLSGIAKALKTTNAVFVAEIKLDGIAAVLTYIDGELSRAATRGDGFIGNDITHHVKAIKNVPLKLKGNDWPKYLEVAGEIVIPIKAFEHLNEQNRLAGIKTYANPRNAAAGIIAQLDPALSANKPLKFIAYRVPGQNQIATHHSLSMMKLKEWGFDVNEQHLFVLGDAVTQFCIDAEAGRDKLPIEIDGLVFKLDDLALQNQLGERSKHPRWAMAFKFAPVEELTVLLDIDFQLGRTGVLTPMARVNPVQVGGVVVSNATLHNMAHVRNLKIMVGDDVVVRRAGDVVPQLAWSVQGRMRDEDVTLTLECCPFCGGAVEEDAGGSLFCVGTDCTDKIIKLLSYAVGRNVLDVADVGPSFVEKCVKTLDVKSIPDLFNLRDEQLELVTSSESGALKKAAAFAAARHQQLERLIMSLGIHNCADGTSATLARFYPSLRRISELTIEELEELPDIGDVVAASVRDFFSKYPDIVDQYEAIFTIKDAPKHVDSSLDGHLYLVSGKRFGGWSRKEMETYIQLRGGKLASGVSKNVTAMFAGLDCSDGKVTKANKLGVKVLYDNIFESKTTL